MSAERGDPDADAAQLIAKLHRLELLNPDAHARIMWLFDRMAENPDMSDAEFSDAVSEMMGIPPGKTD